MVSSPTKRTYREAQDGQYNSETTLQSEPCGAVPSPLSSPPFSSDPKNGDNEICYGALLGAAAAFLNGVDAPGLLATQRADGSLVTFKLTARDRHYVLQLDGGIDFAILDTRTTANLKAVREQRGLSFDAIADSSVLSKRKKGGTRQTRSFPISVNVFGPKCTSDDVGSRFSDVSAYLQHPKIMRAGVKYCNPQFLAFSDDENDMDSLVGIGNDSTWARNVRISDEVSGILESLEDVAGTQELKGLPPMLNSSLKGYQEDGVRFILQRETICRNQLVVELSASTSTSADMVQEPVYGGLIADSMGLGKTLTTLTAILSSVQSAESFGDFYDESATGLENTRTKATLIVVSSAQLIENWKDEIQEHFVPETFKVVTFHGPSRSQDTASLVHADLVLTTYATLATDHRGLGILHKMDWFRVVLDEAHWIRNSSSRQFCAVSALTTRRRWCLTGTPIQNKLNDLTSLAEFLRLPPFPTRRAFEKNIIGPLWQGGPNFSRPLREYLKAYCLRRTAKCLKLPTSSQKTIILDFCVEEKELYQKILVQVRRDMDEIVSARDTLKKYNKLFIAILRMRLLCNLGTLPRRSESLQPQGQGNANCERCEGTDEDISMLLASFSFCPDCNRPLGLSSPLGELPSSQASDAEYTPGHLTPASGEGSQNTWTDNPSSVRAPTSTKLSAVVRTLNNHGPGVKHLVFSYWTSTLDSLAQMVRDAGISYVLIDGRTSYPNRSRYLREFREDPHITVLLMSIETGGIGLNLTVAQTVHIVEPQWNPSVEEQAISRILRMGQTKEVTIFRYIMRGTVEQNIVSLQQRKKNIAKFTFDSETDSVDGKLKDLKFTLFAETT